MLQLVGERHNQLVIGPAGPQPGGHVARPGPDSEEAQHAVELQTPPVGVEVNVHG